MWKPKFQSKHAELDSKYQKYQIKNNQYGSGNNEIGFREPGSQLHAFSWLYLPVVQTKTIKDFQIG